MALYKTGRLIFYTICFVVSLSCKSKTVPVANKQTAIIRSDTLYQLNAANTSCSQDIDMAAEEQVSYKFVQVEVTKVTNPNNIPLMFEVYYQSAQKEKIFLGTFSLYPASQPGKFIVPTQEKVKKEGSVIVSMTSPQSISAANAVQVFIKKFRFIKG